MKTLRPILNVLLLANLLAAAWLYARANERSGSRAEMQRQLHRLNTVVKRVHTSYVDSEKAAPDVLVETALEGMLSQLDENSQYLNRDNYTRMQGEAEGEISGLGIEVTSKAGQLTIVSPLEGTPADRAGLLPGDRILEINGESTDGMDLSEAVERMKGKPATDIDLTVSSSDTNDRQTVSITREVIRVPSVLDVHHLRDGIGYLRISDFNANTSRELAEAMAVLRKSKGKGKGIDESPLAGLILDVRGNPGGLLVSALEVAEQFLPSGSLVVYTQGRDPTDHSQHFARLESPDLTTPLVVLINDKSASAAEIVAGALQDADRATLVGQTSYGKGSVQTVIPIDSGPDSDAIRLTTAKYYTKSGRVIDDLGVDPDVVVDLAREDWLDILKARYERGTAGDGSDDPQIDRAIGVLLGK